MKYFKQLLSLCLWLVILTACREVEKPTSLTPFIWVEEADDVTRNSAVVGCVVQPQGTEKITSLVLHYGHSPEMMENRICEAGALKASVVLTELVPNTTYYYCFEVGNAYSRIRSEVCKFVTAPNRAPVMGDLQLLGQGPVSVILQYRLLDDGGVPVTQSGFCYWKDGEEEQKVESALHDSCCMVHIRQLEPTSSYRIRGYAVNEVGVTWSEEFTFHTDPTVLVVVPGTLGQIIGEEDKYNYEVLTVSGSLNGTDVRQLREMLGRGIDGSLTEGRMSVLDLTDASVVSGGVSYNGTRYTENDVIGWGMFSGCFHLTNLKLPYGTIAVEENAFENCTGLIRLEIPASTLKVTSSSGCTNLECIDVAANNTLYASEEGVLYDKRRTILYWWPEGKKEEVPAWPLNLEEVAAYAFQYFSNDKIELPHSLRKIGVGAFYASHLESVTIPDKVTHLSAALFQGCKKLTSVTLGKNTELLSAFCFDGCPLEHMYVKVKEFPPLCQEETFAGNEHLFKHCTLHVPVGSKLIYSRADGWKNFQNIVDDITEL